MSTISRCCRSVDPIRTPLAIVDPRGLYEVNAGLDDEFNAFESGSTMRRTVVDPPRRILVD
jgi:hypothetical protein